MAKITTSQCQFNKVTKTLVVNSSLFNRRFPEQIEVVSDHTGKSVTFVQDHDAAMKAEFWDGEMFEYKPTTDVPNVKCLVVCHGC